MNAKEQWLMTRRYSLFCGIDVGKANHVACLIDRDGQILIRCQGFDNSASGFARLDERLAEAGGKRPVLLGMEATGHYWYALHEHLVHRGQEVAVLNPIQTAQQAKKQIRKTQTDKIDARHIATLLKNGDWRPAIIPGELAMTCRQLSRLWYALLRQRSRLKQLIRCKLEWLWPEFEGQLSDPLCITGRAILQVSPTPAELLRLPEPALRERIEKTSRGRLGDELVQRLRSAAAQSIGMTRGAAGGGLAIRLLLEQLQATQPVRQRLEEQIAAMSRQLPAYVLSLPGADAIRAVSLFGETDPISAFAAPEQLVAFAGLDITVMQSGQYQAPRRHISKRGSPHLRHTLWTMASVAARREGDLRNYYLRRRRQGMHHLAAVTAVALKLTRVVWRILIDQRDWRPEGPPR
jgi:transposase